MKLRFVKIYFYATTFDRITKDRAAKFVDMLSAIGGTMGLLTGFSIISGVEIVYFVIKIILKILKDRFNNKKQMKNIAQKKRKPYYSTFIKFNSKCPPIYTYYTYLFLLCVGPQCSLNQSDLSIPLDNQSQVVRTRWLPSVVLYSGRVEVNTD